MTDFSLIQCTQWVFESCIHESYREEMEVLKRSPFPSNKDIQSCTLPAEGLRRHTDLGKCSKTASSIHFGRWLRQTMTMLTSTITSHLKDCFRPSLRSQYLIHGGFFARLFSVFSVIWYALTVTAPNFLCKTKATMSHKAEIRSRETQQVQRWTCMLNTRKYW